jgi:hypothetical protein
VSGKRSAQIKVSNTAVDKAANKIEVKGDADKNSLVIVK